MTIIDSQVHAYEANTPKRPWHSVPNWPDHVTGDEMLAAMDKVGVDGAIFISSFSMYQYEGSYAVEVQRAHPGRMAIVKRSILKTLTWGRRRRRVEEDAGRGRHPHHADQRERPRARPSGASGGSRAPPCNTTFRSTCCAGTISTPGTALIERYPDTRFILDHLGILQPREPVAAPQQSQWKPWAELPKVLALAKRPERGDQGQRRPARCRRNRILIRISGIRWPACSDAWGFERCLWGTDWTRAFAVVNYEQAVKPFLETKAPERDRAGHADGRGDCEGVSVGAEEGVGLGGWV